MTENDTIDILLSCGDAARRCMVSPQMIRRWIDSGELPGIRLRGSNHRRVRLTDLLAFMRENQLDPSVPVQQQDVATSAPITEQPEAAVGK